MGAFIGDSCGSFSEFEPELLSDEHMEVCMAMPGGGPFDLAPGQVTDDSELAMCLMNGLVKIKEKDTMDIEKVCMFYRAWIESGPFDIGNNTSGTLGTLTNPGATSETAKYAARTNF